MAQFHTIPFHGTAFDRQVGSLLNILGEFEKRVVLRNTPQPAERDFVPSALDYSRYQGILTPHLRAMAEDYRAGMSCKEIADKLPRMTDGWGPWSASAGNVGYALARIGVPIRRAGRPAGPQPARKLSKSMPPAERRAVEDDVLRRRRLGQTLDQIAIVFGVSGERIRQMAIIAEAREAVRRAAARRWAAIDRLFACQLYRSKGRPLDMGGPRDEWIERDLWSEL